VKLDDKASGASQVFDSYTQQHEHLLRYQNFAKQARMDKFVMHVVTQFDNMCYKQYLDVNIENLDRVWKQHINKNTIQNNYVFGDCGETLTACDVKRWENMFELFQHNEDKQIGEFSLYTHMDPDYFLLYDFTSLKWMTDCVTYGMSFRQMTSNLQKPCISPSHVCFSHELLASVGLGVLRATI
jgi:hypothetical protein